MKDAVAWRQAHHKEGNDSQVRKSKLKVKKKILICHPIQSKCIFFLQTKRSTGSKSLQTGDVYITRHSNLAQVHVIFHMVVNDSLRSGE